MLTSRKFIPSIHLGEILKKEFLVPLGISQRVFPRNLDVPPDRINDIVRGRRSITGNTALRFSMALGTSPEMWLRLQARYELEKAQNEAEPDLKKKITRVA